MEERAKQPANRFKTIALLVLVAAVLGSLILLQREDSAQRIRAQPGLPAPDFSFPGLDGQLVKLSDFRGKVVFLNIWATWCTPCREEMPSMEKLHNALKGEDFQILAVSVDALGAKAVGPFMKKYKLSFPALLDTAGKIQRIYGTTGVPETFIINKEGIIEEKIIGPRDWAKPEAIRFFRTLIQGSSIKK